MKFLMLLVPVAVLFCSQSRGAAISCEESAGGAALQLAHPGGDKPGSPLIVAVKESKLLKKSGSNLYYKVEISFDVVDGYSDSFPPEVYSVLAKGTEQSCKVTTVKLLK